MSSVRKIRRRALKVGVASSAATALVLTGVSAGGTGDGPAAGAPGDPPIGTAGAQCEAAPNREPPNTVQHNISGFANGGGGNPSRVRDVIDYMTFCYEPPQRQPSAVALHEVCDDGTVNGQYGVVRAELEARGYAASFIESRGSVGTGCGTFGNAIFTLEGDAFDPNNDVVSGAYGQQDTGSGETRKYVCHTRRAGGQPKYAACSTHLAGRRSVALQQTQPFNDVLTVLQASGFRATGLGDLNNVPSEVSGASSFYSGPWREVDEQQSKPTWPRDDQSTPTQKIDYTFVHNGVARQPAAVIPVTGSPFDGDFTGSDHDILAGFMPIL